jgi:glycosyltransferase involved in cell wall biosynthesis
MSTFSSHKVFLTAPFTRLGVASTARVEQSRSSSREKTVSGKRRNLPAIQTAPIIAFCHLSWSWVWQRPQQYLSRFSKTHPVLFVETHCSRVDSPAVKLSHQPEYPNVVVAEVHLPEARWHDGAYVDQQRRFAIQTILEDELRGRFDDPILWFNDPMSVVAFAGQMGERLIVYDCMDELTQFRGAPPALTEREEALLRKADVVFTGGRKMREKRLPLNANTHFFGTGVDVVHFGRARSSDLSVAPELAKLKGRILGYFGVIDERIDYDLLAQLADARDDWHVVMVGPTAKVDPKDFPQRANLHWVGPRAYQDLPALTKAFSVCLMPFAINAATEYINPTKALEYMAAGKPVVSTAINEVKTNFASVARVAHNHSEFISACIRECEKPSLARVQAGIKLAAENTWEANIAKMEALIAHADAARRGACSADAADKRSTLPLSAPGLAYV